MKNRILKAVQSWPNGYMLVDGGKCFLIEYVIPYQFKGLFSIILWINSFGNKRWVVSTYNSYEWINTHTGFFAWPFKVDAHMKWGKGNYSVDALNVDDVCQVTHHSPYHY